MGAEEYCHCGSFEQAREIAERLYVDMIASDCPVWAFQVAAALRTICVDRMEQEGMTRSELKTMGDEMTRVTRRDCDRASLDKLALAKREHVHGT